MVQPPQDTGIFLVCQHLGLTSDINIKIYIEEKYNCHEVQARKFKQVSLRAEG